MGREAISCCNPVPISEKGYSSISISRNDFLPLQLWCTIAPLPYRGTPGPPRRKRDQYLLPQQATTSPRPPSSHSHYRPHIVTRTETQLLPLPIGKEEFIIMIYYKMSGALFVLDSNTLSSQVAPRAANLRGFR